MRVSLPISYLGAEVVFFLHIFVAQRFDSSSWHNIVNQLNGHRKPLDAQSLGLQSHTACKTLVWIHPTEHSSHLLSSPGPSASSPRRTALTLQKEIIGGVLRRRFFLSVFLKVGQAVTTQASGCQLSLLSPFWLVQFTLWEKRRRDRVSWSRVPLRETDAFPNVLTRVFSQWGSNRGPRDKTKKWVTVFPCCT